MGQLLEFAGNHPILVLLFFSLLGALVWTFVGGAGARRIGPMDATRLINHEDAVVLDVRPEAEFKEGHIVNAVHIPMTELESRVDKLHKHRERPIVAVCRAGSQSAAACKLLQKRGFSKVYSLSGGILAWQGASLPLTRK